ncbi:hypothetical protein Afil01_19510 [Actinorhabdospora filicis]|uniref:DUF3073 domain-containing protein n=1 Tax=Actinorhabdospora filicis TaxID=1785913 RepID=A0A9W6SHB7_9ACTN|nr:DUF3073 domain-containing protein [Actinorhabdospora filicis]GLZ77144.1 hypothetical protein Afil01_19510 [Actinorhabdospora filicis]
MGRGRAKAKQTKVARRLKYHSPNTDFSALQQELGTDGAADDEYEETDDDEFVEVDAYADVGQDTDERDPREEDWLPRKR